MKRRVAVVITGLTGSGKTDIAECLAKKVNGQLITGDATQLVRQISVLNNKPTENKGIHLLGTIDGFSNYTVTNYVSSVYQTMHQISSLQQLPIIEGGSVFYIHALLQGLSLLSYGEGCQEGEVFKKAVKEVDRLLYKANSAKEWYGV